MTTHNLEAKNAEKQPDFELAGSMQAVLNECADRDFSLDIQQQEAFGAIANAIIDGKSSGYIEMATSTGKTALEALLAEAAARAGRRVLIIAPTISIARQIVGKNAEKQTGLARFSNLPDSTSVRSHFGNKRANQQVDIVVTTYLGLVSDARLDHSKLGQFDVVIADECHRSLGEKTSEVLKNVYPDAFKLGLSATPDYALDRRSDEVYDTSLYEFSLLNAVESGKTAPVRALIYETNETLQLTDNRKEFTDRELAPLIDNPQRNATALSLTEAFVKEGRQGVIACIPGQTNLHARLLADLLKERGVHATDVGAHLSPEDMALCLKLYDNGTFDVLTFTRALEEGWDSDKASFAINMVPTSSPVRTKQLLGRVLRKKSDDRDSVYVDFIDKKSGVAKSQYTALHALELESIDFNRTLGRYGETKQRPWGETLALLHTINPKLAAQLRSSQGKLLRNVAVGERVDPLVLEWEKTLADERMPAELDANSALPARLAKTAHKAYAKWYYDNQTQPSSEELMEYMGKLTEPQRHIIGKYGIRTVFDELDEIDQQEIAANDELSDPHMIAEENALFDQVRKVLDTLSEREAGVIAMRFGLDDGAPKDLDKIGKAYGVTRERIRQIESKTMSKLRHPSRRDILRDYLIDETDKTRPTDQQKNDDLIPKINSQNEYVKRFTEFEVVNPIQSIPLKKYVMSRFESLQNDGVIDDDTDKHPILWKTVVAACDYLEIHFVTNESFDEKRKHLEGAITTFEQVLERLYDLPIAQAESSLEQRIATTEVYESRVKYLKSYMRELDRLETFLAKNNGLIK